jgi:hypothetical protein
MVHLRRMPKAFFFFSGPLFLICALVLFAECGDHSNAAIKAGGSAQSWGDLSQLRSGDIIVKRGKGLVSKKITSTLSEPIPLSHCGVIVREGDSLHVIHSLAKEITGIDGVQKMPMPLFLDDCIKGYVYVVRYSKEDRQDAIAASAGEFLRRQVPFDYQLNNKDAASVTCSELVYWNLKEATGKDCLDKLVIDNREVFAFNSLLDTRNFKTIYHQ